MAGGKVRLARRADGDALESALAAGVAEALSSRGGADAETAARLEKALAAMRRSVLEKLRGSTVLAGEAWPEAKAPVSRPAAGTP
eukprot:CAMPEP_0183797896 /NCGR_PEP_ID=MMETSP0803_2-20130417/17438_1 /TAXON_ID=195967 /ORGANISM="Crustomastix stigmata, Strain CCMP3273" /LENGTH=84 /DNA_ID=CAMNT_0026042567 /DNA_START=5 /DNA_END=255 /DNA_ORIENTATION=-